MDYKNILKDANEKIAELIEEVSPEEERYSSLEQYFYENPQEAILLKGRLQDIEERKRYANKIFWMVVMWLVCILLIVVLGGIEFNTKKRILNISDTVILALIGSTTINITAFFVIVTKYLFPSSNSN